MANSVLEKTAIAKQKRGAGSPTGNREKYASQRYRDTLSRWTHCIQSKEGFNLTDRSLGEYITKFIEYFEFSTGQKCRVRDGDKNGYSGRWKAAHTTPSFQKLEEDSWVLHFISFCITGELYSNFNVTEYLETGNESLLPNRAWEYKKIPLYLSKPTAIAGDVQVKIKQLEDLVLSLQKKVEAMEPTVKTVKVGVSFSSLLDSWMKAESQRRRLSVEIVLIELSNRLGPSTTVVELEDIIHGTYPMDKNQYKYYVKAIANLSILKNADDQPYSGKELLDLPPGITVTG